MRILLLMLCALWLIACAEAAPPTPVATPTATVPSAWVGNSAELSLGSIEFSDITPNDVNRFQAETFNLRHFDASQALLLADGEKSTVAFAQFALKDAARWAFLYDWGQPMISLGDYAFFQRTDAFEDPFARHVDVALEHTFAADDYTLLLRGVSAERTETHVNIRAFWQQLGEPSDIELTALLVSESGETVAEWRGLGVAWADWRMDDTLFQLSELPLDTLASGPFTLKVGVGDDLVDGQTIP